MYPALGFSCLLQPHRFSSNSRLTNPRPRIYELVCFKTRRDGRVAPRPQLAKSRLFPAPLHKGGFPQGEETHDTNISSHQTARV